MLKNGANFMKKLIFNKCIGINLVEIYLVTEKGNESFERVNFYEQIINQITLNDISKLAKRYFDENYFETTQLIKQ